MSEAVVQSNKPEKHEKADKNEKNEKHQEDKRLRSILRLFFDSNSPNAKKGWLKMRGFIYLLLSFSLIFI